MNKFVIEEGVKQASVGPVKALNLTSKRQGEKLVAVGCACGFRAC
jgi:hypothetical protein